MKITSVEPQKKIQGRYNVYVDGEFAAGVSEDTLLEFKLMPGREVSQATLAEAAQADAARWAFELAVHTLAVKRRTSGEVYDYIVQKGVDKNSAEDAVARAGECGYIDDYAYCCDFIEEMKQKGKSRRYTKDKLFAHRADKVTIDEALAACYPREDEAEIAREFAAGIRETDRNKRYRKLANQGFDSSVISEVLRDGGEEAW